MGIRPNIGIRIKLASSGSGKWEESGGDASKFGLTSAELLDALDMLDKKDMRDCLRLIHFHIGSQITKIRRIQTALREASQFYIQLHKMGYNVDFVDCGAAHVLLQAKAPSTTVSKNTSMTVSTPLLMQPTRITFPILTSLQKVDAHWLPITLYWLLMCWKQPHYQRCQRNTNPTKMPTN